ncbi:hypothetical protein [Streptomyces sp. NPDC052107]
MITSTLNQPCLSGDAGQVTQTTPLGSAQATVYRNCDIKPPSRITAANPA